MDPTPDAHRQFLDRLVHDLREPLRSVHAFSQILAENLKGRLEPADEEILSQILTGTSRMGELLEGVSRFTSAMHDGAPGASLDLAFRSAMSKLEAEVAASGATVAAGQLPRVGVSLERLIQLLENLLRNALTFHGEGPTEIHLLAELQAGGDWRVTVEDNGIGIDPADFETVFAPFTKLNGRKYSGAGLGLTVCRTIVERHSGRIWVESRDPSGCAICLTLPACE
ncbi:MAG: ATP-binding protein [Bryobacteraceae bacterium]